MQSSVSPHLKAWVNPSWECKQVGHFYTVCIYPYSSCLARLLGFNLWHKSITKSNAGWMNVNWTDCKVWQMKLYILLTWIHFLSYSQIVMSINRFKSQQLYQCSQLQNLKQTCNLKHMRRHKSLMTYSGAQNQSLYAL